MDTSTPIVYLLPQHCDGCGRPAAELPAFGPGPFADRKLARNYRGPATALWSSWECAACFPLSDAELAAVCLLTHKPL